MQPSHYEDQYFLYITKNDWIQVLNFFQIKLGMTAHVISALRRLRQIRQNPATNHHQTSPTPPKIFSR